MPDFVAFPDLKSFPASSNIHIEQGKAMPSFDHGAMVGTEDILHYFIKEAIETQNPAGNPRQYALGNRFAYYHEDGIKTIDTTFGDVVQGDAIVDDGTGAKILIVGFGTGNPDLSNPTWTGNFSRNLGTDTAPWTANTAADTSKATFWKIITVGPDAIAMTGNAATGLNLGRTLLNEYKIAKCPAGNDPRLAVSWGNIQPVGTPNCPIIDIAPLYDSFCVAKADGLWYWDARVHRFINAMPHIPFHLLNGKGMASGENCVWYPDAYGRLFRFDGTNVQERTPRKGIVVPRDSYTSRVTAIADRGDIVVARMEPNYSSLTGPRASAAQGLKVITYINGAFVDITASVTNGKLSDGGSMAAFGVTANDRLFIGANAPFEAGVFRVTRLPNAASVQFGTPSYSNITAGTVAPFTSSFTAFSGIRDGTKLKFTTSSLVLTGYPPGASEAIVTWPDINAYDVMKLTSLAFGGSIGTLVRYWAVIPPSQAGAGMTNPTEIDEVDIVPSRGGMPNTGLLTTTTNYSHRENSGSVGKFYVSKDAGLHWEPTYTIDDGGGVWAMQFTSARSGTMTNGGAPLLAWGRYQQSIIALSVTGDPSTTQYPKLVQGSATKPMPHLSVRKLELATEEGKLTRLHKITVETQYVTSADQLAIYAWWDNDDYVRLLDNSSGAPWTFYPPAENPVGRELNFDIYFADASQSDPTAPYISKVVVSHTDETAAMPIGQAFSIPERI